MSDPAIEFDKYGQGWVRADADHSKCKVSSCIAEATSYGRGELDYHGFWEYGCYHCARKSEQNSLPEYDECWPFSKETIESTDREMNRLDVFKIKCRGSRIKLRRMLSSESIDSRTMHRLKSGSSSVVPVGVELHESKCQGELVASHPAREYFRVESDWFKMG